MLEIKLNDMSLKKELLFFSKWLKYFVFIFLLYKLQFKIIQLNINISRNYAIILNILKFIFILKVKLREINTINYIILMKIDFFNLKLFNQNNLNYFESFFLLFKDSFIKYNYF